MKKSLIISDIKQNLGIMICLDKDQEKLKDLMDEFPLLHESNCLCWLEGWSADTLRKMPSLVIRRYSPSSNYTPRLSYRQRAYRT